MKTVSQKNLTNIQKIIAEAITATMQLFQASLGGDTEISILLDDAYTALQQALANIENIVPQR